MLRVDFFTVNFLEQVKDWAFSSFYRVVCQGIYEISWCGTHQLNSSSNGMEEV
jgi:hypothetical protein